MLAARERVRAFRRVAYVLFPIALVIELIALAMGVELSGQRAFEATTICAGVVLCLGLAAHIGASVLDPRDPMEGGGDAWGDDDDLRTPFTATIDRAYWILSWPLIPLFMVATIARARRADASARTVAQEAIERARRRRGRPNL